VPFPDGTIIEAGTTTFMILKTEDNDETQNVCENKSVELELMEADENNDDDYIDTFSPSIVSTNYGLNIWTAEWIDDSDDSGNPEYYFVANLNGSGQSYISGLIEVSP
jgi:hypothetical protein